jgi:hypothetical protein
MNRIVREDLVERVKPILERTALFKLPLGDPFLVAEETETYPHLIPEIIEPFIKASSACFLFPPKKGIDPNYLDLFEPTKERRTLLTLKRTCYERATAQRDFWYIDSETRGEFCFIIPVDTTLRNHLYAGSYMATGFMNVGSVLSRRAIEFARAQTEDATHLCVYYSEVGPSKLFFVFGAESIITNEWLCSLLQGKCDERMWPHFFHDPKEVNPQSQP